MTTPSPLYDHYLTVNDARFIPYSASYKYGVFYSAIHAHSDPAHAAMVAISS